MKPELFGHTDNDLGKKKKPEFSKKAPSPDAFLEMYAESIRKQLEEEISAKYKNIINEKDREILRLKKLLEQANANKSSSQPQKSPLSYNRALFSLADADSIIYAIIDLANTKRNNGKYLINNKTDWYIVCRVLQYFKHYTASPNEFINIVNECVLPAIKDEDRKVKLSLTSTNFTTIRPDNPIRAISVLNWKKHFDKERENDAEKSPLHGTSLLERAVNILFALQKILKSYGIESFNYKSEY